MRALTHRPEGIVPSAISANLIGSVLASFLYLLLMAPNQELSKELLELIKSAFSFSIPAFFIGLFFVLVYAAPVMAIARRFGFGGPVVAMIVGFLPALVAAAIDPARPIGVLAFYGPTVALIFCFFAYTGVFSNK